LLIDSSSQSPRTCGTAGATDGAGEGAGRPVVRITDLLGNEVATVQQQTAQQAAEYLRRRFGDGTLEDRNGTGVAPDSELAPGVDYIFRPAEQPPAPVAPASGPLERPNTLYAHRQAGRSSL
jgi:hypothetical protein